MPFKVFQRKNLARRIPELQRAERDKQNSKVEGHLDHNDDDAGNYTDLTAVDKFDQVLCRRRVNINLKGPAQREEDEYPEVVRPQAFSHRFPFADREMR